MQYGPETASSIRMILCARCGAQTDSKPETIALAEKKVYMCLMITAFRIRRDIFEQVHRCACKTSNDRKNPYQMLVRKANS
jgi:hypothetical protein